MPGYTKIKQAVDFLGLAGTFGNPQLKVTVFVPNDNAFAAAQKRNPAINEQVIMANKGILQQVVYYHIAKDVVTAPLPSKTFDTFLTGKTVKGNGNKVDGAYSSANIVQPNVKCGAGYAHGIDSVLMFAQLPGR